MKLATLIFALIFSAQLFASFVYKPATTADFSLWGDINGTLSDQTDLQSALNAKLAKSSSVVFLNGSTSGLALSGTTWLVSGKTPGALTVNNLIGGASLLSTCTTNPTVTLYDCGSTTTCDSSPTTVGSVTITATSTSTVGTVSSPTIAAGSYWLLKISAGSCASTSLWAVAEASVQ